VPSGTTATMTVPRSAASRNESECQHLPRTLDHHRSPLSSASRVPGSLGAP
jgi:hypothetical protein